MQVVTAARIRGHAVGWTSVLLLVTTALFAWLAVPVTGVPAEPLAAPLAYDYDGTTAETASYWSLDSAVPAVVDGSSSTPGFIYDAPDHRVATNGVGVANGLTTKSAAREALAQLDLTAEQLAAANRAIGRATTSSTIDVVQRGSDVIVRISRPGVDGFQVFESVVSPSGAKSVLQTAYDSAGNLVHYDPKTP